MKEELVNCIIGALSGIFGAGTSWFFTRKKYNEEVKKSVFENYEDRFRFQDTIIKNLEEKLDRNLDIEKSNSKKIVILKDAITKMLNETCTDYNCKQRNSYSREAMIDILDKM